MLLAALAVCVVNLGLIFAQARAFKKNPRLGRRPATPLAAQLLDAKGSPYRR